MRNVIAGFVAVLLGCSSGLQGESEESAVTESQRASILTYLSVHGFDTTDVQFRDNIVLVEGDIAFNLLELLEQVDQPVDKGYRSLFTLDPLLTSGIDMTFASNLPSAWRTAFDKAACLWSNASTGGQDVNVDINRSNPGHDIDVEFAPFWVGGAVPGVPNTTTFAVSTFPCCNGLSPGTVTVNANYAFADCPLTDDVRLSAALHEIGHAIGLKHPGEGTHIPNTDLASAGTSTVMKPFFCDELTMVFADDRRSIRELYGFSNHALRDCD